MSHETAPNTTPVAETRISAESAYDQQTLNEQLLSTSEIGPFMVDAYRSAVELDPRMSEIAIVPIEDPEDPRMGVARAKDANTNVTGKHEIHIRLNDLDGILAMYEARSKDHPEAIAMIAERIGVSPEEVTPQLLHVQTMLHEMGHLTEHMDDEEAGDPRRGMERRKKEMASLPLGAIAVGKLSNPNSAESQYFEANWQRHAQEQGDISRDDLIALQAMGYRNLTSERIADNFAADVFTINPELKTQMQFGNLDEYRSHTEMANMLHESEQPEGEPELTPEQAAAKRRQYWAEFGANKLEEQGTTPDQAQANADQLTAGLTAKVRSMHEQAAQEGRSLTNDEKGFISGVVQTLQTQKDIMAVFLARQN